MRKTKTHTVMSENDPGTEKESICDQCKVR